MCSLIPPLVFFFTLGGEFALEDAQHLSFFSHLHRNLSLRKAHWEEGASFIAVKFSNRLVVFRDYIAWLEWVGFKAMCQFLGCSSSCHVLFQHCFQGRIWLGFFLTEKETLGGLEWRHYLLSNGRCGRIENMTEARSWRDLKSIYAERPLHFFWAVLHDKISFPLRLSCLL